MSFLDPHVTRHESGFSFTRLQASRFAKQVADDYNPIHDVGAKRFCVPGDLLFAFLVSEKGLHSKMHFTFSGMVADQVELLIQDTAPGELQIQDARGKEYLKASYSGAANRDPELIEELIRSYVRFSGHNFPHILQPLMAKHQVMINIERPLVIYESMTIQLAREDIHRPQLELAEATLEVDGKRGNATMLFRFLENGAEVGIGEKKMVLSGLREYEELGMAAMVDLYDQRKRERVE